MRIVILSLSLFATTANAARVPEFLETTCVQALASLKREPQLNDEVSVLNLEGPRAHAYLNEMLKSIKALDIAVHEHRTAKHKKAISSNKIAALAAGVALGSVILFYRSLGLPEADRLVPELFAAAGFLGSFTMLMPLALAREFYLESHSYQSSLFRHDLIRMQNASAVSEVPQLPPPATTSTTVYLRRDLVDHAINIGQGELDPKLIARTLDYAHYFDWLGPLLPGRLRATVAFHLSQTVDGQPALTIVTWVYRGKIWGGLLSRR